MDSKKVSFRVVPALARIDTYLITRHPRLRGAYSKEPISTYESIEVTDKRTKGISYLPLVDGFRHKEGFETNHGYGAPIDLPSGLMDAAIPVFCNDTSVRPENGWTRTSFSYRRVDRVKTSALNGLQEQIISTADSWIN